MKFNLKLITKTLLGSALLLLIGCSKEEDTPQPITDNGGTNNPTYSVPAIYAFVDGSSNSTVDYSGQEQRLEMLSEMVTYMKTGNTVGNFLDATQLKNMYANNAYTWVDAPSLGMTGSSKQLKSKTAAGDIGVQFHKRQL